MESLELGWAGSYPPSCCPHGAQPCKEMVQRGAIFPVWGGCNFFSTTKAWWMFSTATAGTAQPEHRVYWVPQSRCTRQGHAEGTQGLGHDPLLGCLQV